MNWNQYSFNSKHFLTKVRNSLLSLNIDINYEFIIKNIILSYPYTIVQLQDGLEGIALNYQFMLSNKPISFDEINSLRKYLLSQIPSDPLLESTLLRKINSLTLTEIAVIVATISAISQYYIQNNLLERTDILISQGKLRLQDIATVGDTILIIGWGGFLKEALNEPKIRKIIVSDLNVNNNIHLNKYKKEIESFRTLLKDRSFILCDGVNLPILAKDSHIVAITGSTLCNGTLLGLLKLLNTKYPPITILQGHSANLVSPYLFDEGIDYIVQDNLRNNLIEDFISKEHPVSNFMTSIDEFFSIQGNRVIFRNV